MLWPILVNGASAAVASSSAVVVADGFFSLLEIWIWCVVLCARGTVSFECIKHITKRWILLNRGYLHTKWLVCQVRGISSLRSHLSCTVNGMFSSYLSTWSREFSLRPFSYHRSHQLPIPQPLPTSVCVSKKWRLAQAARHHKQWRRWRYTAKQKIGVRPRIYSNRM